MQINVTNGFTDFMVSRSLDVATEVFGGGSICFGVIVSSMKRYAMRCTGWDDILYDTDSCDAQHTQQVNK